MQNRKFWTLAAVAILAWWRPCLAQNPGDSQSIHSVKSPNKQFEAVWCDVGESEGDNAMLRIITLVDVVGMKSLFSEVSRPRYTGAVWNLSSDHSAIYDAPDNANTRLWVFIRDSKGAWNQTNVDLYNLVKPKLPVAEIPENPRGGIETIQWKTESMLMLTVIYINKYFEVEIDTSRKPFSSHVEDLKRSFGK